MTRQTPKAGWFEKLLVLLGRRRIVLVEGESMYPTLRGGDKVIVDAHSAIRIGDIVLAEHPFKSGVRIIKRVTDIAEDGRYFLQGDNPIESSDSRSFGTLHPSNIHGRITAIS